MVGGAGSANAMRAIEAGDSVLEATVIYPHTQARRRHQAGPPDRPGQEHVRPDLAGRCRARIVLNAPVVTKDNVDQYIDNAFES